MKNLCVVSRFDAHLPLQPVVACLTGSSPTEKTTAQSCAGEMFPHLDKPAEGRWLALSQESPKASDYDTLCKLWHLSPGAQTKRTSRNISRALQQEEFETEMLCFFRLLPARVCVYYSGWGLGGKLVLLMKMTSCGNKWTVNASHKESRIASGIFSSSSRRVLKLDESFWAWITFLCVLLCSAPYSGWWAVLSLHERNNLKWRNTSMSPFPPLQRVIIQLIFFFSLPQPWFLL